MLNPQENQGSDQGAVEEKVALSRSELQALLPDPQLLAAFLALRLCPGPDIPAASEQMSLLLQKSRSNTVVWLRTMARQGMICFPTLIDSSYQFTSVTSWKPPSARRQPPRPERHHRPNGG